MWSCKLFLCDKLYFELNKFPTVRGILLRDSRKQLEFAEQARHQYERSPEYTFYIVLSNEHIFRFNGFANEDNERI